MGKVKFSPTQTKILFLMAGVVIGFALAWGVQMLSQIIPA